MLDNPISGDSIEYFPSSVLYPSRLMLFINNLVALLFIFVCFDNLLSHFETIPTLNNLGVWGIEVIGYSLLLAYATVTGVCCTGRFFAKKPTLVIDDLGLHITPLLFSRVTLVIAWEEIAAFSFYGQSIWFNKSLPAFFASLHSYSGLFISLVPECEEPVLMRQSRFNRAFVQRNKISYPFGIYIPRLLLPASEMKVLRQLQTDYQARIEQNNIHILRQG